jgi:superfamily II DNA or RNA helicase
LRSRVPEQRAEAADVAAKKKKARKADRKYKRERRKRLGIFKKKKGSKKGGEGEEEEGEGGGGDARGSDSSSSSDDDDYDDADDEEGVEEVEAIGTAPAATNDAFDWEVDDAAEAADDAAEEEGLDESARHLLRTQREYYRGVHAVRDRTVAQPQLVTGGELRSYQVSGLRFMASLVNNKVNGILADEMGLGKTVQTIALVAHLLERGQLAGPHLILAPKAVLPNWSAEFARWAPGLTAVLYDGAPEQRRAIREKWLSRPRSFHALLTHYDLAMRDARALRSLPGGWGLLVVDEGHRLKNADARLATALRSLTAAHRILLTGTPLQNSLAELWALLNFVLPKVFDSAASFDEWFAAPLGDGGGGPGMASPGTSSSCAGSAAPLTEEEQLLVITRLHQVLRPFVLRRTKAEVESDLPDKTSRTVRCGLSAWQAAWYRQIARKGRATLGSSSGGGGGSGGGGSTGQNTHGMMRGGLRNIAMQLRKVCIHPYLFLDNPNSSYSCGLDYSPSDPEELVRASGKVALLDTVLEKLKATGHRVLLFSQMTRALDVLGDFLDLRGHTHLRLDGSTKTEDRARLLRDFNAPDSPHFVFLLSTRAGGLGLNLQSADTVIMFDSDWNPASDAQAEDRAHRIGQTKDVLVLVLAAAGTIEEVILDRAARKRELDAKVIQAGMFNDASTHRERTRALQALLAAGDPGGVAGGGSDAMGATSGPAINRALARGPDELAVFKAIDARRKAALKGKAPLLTDAEIPDFARNLLGGPEEDLEEEEDPKVAAARRREELRKEAAADAEAAAAGQRRSRRSKPGGAVSYREPGENDFALSGSDSEEEGVQDDDEEDAGASEIESLLDSEESDEEAELRAKAKAAARRARKAEDKEKKGGKGNGKVADADGEEEEEDDEEESEEDEEDLEVHAAPVKRGRGRPPKNAPLAAARETPAAAAAAAAAAKGKKRAASATPAAESGDGEEEEEKPKSRGGAARGGPPSSSAAASKRSRLPSGGEQPAAAAAAVPAGRRSGRSDGEAAAPAATAPAATTTATKAKKKKNAAAPPSSDNEEPPAKRGRGRPPVSYKE